MRSPLPRLMIATSTWCWMISASGSAEPGARLTKTNADRQTIITDLVDGQYRNPDRVVAFNIAKGWSRDVSEELAEEMPQRCAIFGFDVPLRSKASSMTMAAPGLRICRYR
jgi:hypothetical protein